MLCSPGVQQERSKMVYFWQKQIRSFRNNNISGSHLASPLLSAAATAADTALAAVIVSKSASPSFVPTLPSSSLSSSKKDGPPADDIHDCDSTISGSIQETGSNLGRTTSSSGLRDNSNASTSKIHTLVLDKLSEYSRRKQETNKRKVAERELDSLNMKIDKLLSKMDDTDVKSPEKFRREEECVVCMAAPANMKTFPCGHRVVCRKCLIKTMQVAISQRCLPLRCVICRDRILSLQHAQDFGKSNTTTTTCTSSSTFSFETDLVNDNIGKYGMNIGANNNYYQYRWCSVNNNDSNVPNNNNSNSNNNNHSTKMRKGSLKMSRSNTTSAIHSPIRIAMMSTSASSSSSSPTSSSSAPLDGAHVHQQGRQDHLNDPSISHWFDLK